MPSSILLVEDDPIIQALLVETLASDGGFAVQAAGTVGQAKAMLGSGHVPFDAVLLDAGLPDGNGRELCADLRRQGFDGLILLLSGHSSEDDIVCGLEAGADDYLVKPFSLRELLARVASMLRHVPSRAILDGTDLAAAA